MKFSIKKFKLTWDKVSKNLHSKNWIKNILVIILKTKLSLWLETEIIREVLSNSYAIFSGFGWHRRWDSLFPIKKYFVLSIDSLYRCKIKLERTLNLKDWIWLEIWKSWKGILQNSKRRAKDSLILKLAIWISWTRIAEKSKRLQFSFMKLLCKRKQKEHIVQSFFHKINVTSVLVNLDFYIQLNIYSKTMQ